MAKKYSPTLRVIERWAENHGTAVKVIITAALMSFVVLMFVFPHIFFVGVGVGLAVAAAWTLLSLFWDFATIIYGDWYYKKPR